MKRMNINKTWQFLFFLFFLWIISNYLFNSLIVFKASLFIIAGLALLYRYLKKQEQKLTDKILAVVGYF